MGRLPGAEAGQQLRGEHHLEPLEAALAGFTVIVTCSSAIDASGPVPKNSYVLVANSSSGTYGQPGYVHRVVSSTFTDATG